ncbi:MAG: polyphenol oxidase family protein [Acidobacteriota bacterium]
MAWIEEDDFREIRVRFAGKGWPSERRAAVEALTPDGVEGAWLDQIHSADVHGTADPGCAGRGDALVTDRRGLALSVVTADCVPVLLAAGGQIAAVHAGWRGVVAGVVPAAGARFVDRPDVAWIGPAISGEVYEVSDEVASAVVEVSAPEVRRPGPRGRPHVDLRRAVEIQLERLGVPEIRHRRECTLGHPELWSYRQQGADAGRNYSLIWRSA